MGHLLGAETVNNSFVELMFMSEMGVECDTCAELLGAQGTVVVLLFVVVLDVELEVEAEAECRGAEGADVGLNVFVAGSVANEFLLMFKALITVGADVAAWRSRYGSREV